MRGYGRFTEDELDEGDRQHDEWKIKQAMAEAKNKLVCMMVNSLEEKAKKCGVDLSGITSSNFNTYLDDAFQDGGHVRCIYFVDYARDESPFPLASDEDNEWVCNHIGAAIKSIQERNR